MINDDYKKEILKAALDARIKEVTEYQVNIDNFRLAITYLQDDPELVEFKATLQNLLASNILEQKKSKVMLHVIQSQLKE